MAVIILFSNSDKTIIKSNTDNKINISFLSATVLQCLFNKQFPDYKFNYIACLQNQYGANKIRLPIKLNLMEILQ